jgi:hypothetical protein
MAKATMPPEPLKKYTVASLEEVVKKMYMCLAVASNFTPKPGHSKIYLTENSSTSFRVEIIRYALLICSLYPHHRIQISSVMYWLLLKKDILYLLRSARRITTKNRVRC